MKTTYSEKGIIGFSYSRTTEIEPIYTEDIDQDNVPYLPSSFKQDKIGVAGTILVDPLNIPNNILLAMNGGKPFNIQVEMENADDKGLDIKVNGIYIIADSFGTGNSGELQLTYVARSVIVRNKIYIKAD